MSRAGRRTPSSAPPLRIGPALQVVVAESHIEPGAAFAGPAGRGCGKSMQSPRPQGRFSLRIAGSGCSLAAIDRSVTTP